MPSDPMPIQRWPTAGAMSNIPFQFKPVSDARMGKDGVAAVEIMEIYWEDLEDAVVALLGYSWRDASSGTPVLRRKLPWQHPYFNQLFVKNISHAAGVQPIGNSVDNGTNFQPALGGVGGGYASNQGPWSEFSRAELTVQFQRPPYFIRSDADILDLAGNPQEWLRYLDKDWKPSASMLSRDAAQFVWSGSGQVAGLPGGLGQVVTKMDLRKRWYEIPEEAIFSKAGKVPVGIPTNLCFTNTTTINPITGYAWAAGGAMLDTVNAPIGTGVSLVDADTHSTTTIDVADTSAWQVGDCVSSPSNFVTVSGRQQPVIPTGAYITSIPDATTIVISVAARATVADVQMYVISDPVESRIFGCPMGTLLYKGMVPNQRELQLPPYLMQIPFFAGNEAIAQVQYDVDLIYQYFNPPTVDVLAPKGHNLMPWSRTGFWYPINNQVIAGTFAPVTTPFQYHAPEDIFRII